MTLFNIFKKHILSPTEILEKTINKLLSTTTTPSTIKRQFSRLVYRIQAEAYKTYLDIEKAAGKNAIKKYLMSIIPKNTTSNKIIEITASKFKEFDRFFLSIIQSRKPRAGGTFEITIRTLFKRLNYPFEEQQIINGKPDFLMPSKSHFDTNPMDCIIFTAKRTLRERWRQIVTEGSRGLGFYLATIDEKVTKPQLQEMLKNRIYLVMPASMKISIKHYKAAPNVLSFEEFFTHHLDPAVKRWKKSRVL